MFKKEEIEIEFKGKKAILGSWMFFLGYLLVTFITYELFLHVHYSVDSYMNIFYMNAEQNLTMGRFLIYGIVKFLTAIHFNVVLEQLLFTFVLICSITFTQFVLFKDIVSIINTKNYTHIIFIFITIAIAFNNVFLLEWFLYPEMDLFFSFALLFMVLAVHIIYKSLNKFNILLSFLFLSTSLNFYQATLGFYIEFCLLIILLKNQFSFNIELVKDSIKILLIGLFSSMANVLLLKLALSTHIARSGERNPSFSIHTILNNIKGLFQLQPQIWNSAYGFLPKHTMFTVGLILIFLIFYTIFLKVKLWKDRLFLFIFLAVCYMIIFAPHLLTQNLWTAQRTIVSFFAFLSIIFIILFHLNYDNKTSKFIFIIVVLFLCINVFQIQDIGINHFASNKLDQQYSIIVNQEIEKYEKQSHIKVTKIACVNDSHPSYSYQGIFYTVYDTNVRAFVTPWADINMLNYYNKKNYVKIDMNPTVYDKYFKDKNWDYFNPDEQLVFVGDTLYWIKY